MFQSVKYFFSRYELFWFLVVARLKLTKKDLMLGYIWWLLDPLILMLVYWFLVTIIFQRGGENYAFFILCGLLPFRAVSSSVNQSVSSVASKFNLISQINFPRIFLPLADVLANHIKLLAGFIIILLVGSFFGFWPTVYFPLVLLPFIVQLLLVSGISLFMSIFGSYVRDIRNLTPFFTRFWMYTSPVLYSAKDIPEDLTAFFNLNPMVPVIESYRAIFMQHDITVISLASSLLPAFLVAIVLLFVGLVFFLRYENNILKRL